MSEGIAANKVGIVTHQYGILRAKVGADFMIGREQKRVTELRLYQGKTLVYCTKCKKSWKDEKTMGADHPSARDMHANQERHVFYFQGETGELLSDDTWMP